MTVLGKIYGGRCSSVQFTRRCTEAHPTVLRKVQAVREALIVLRAIGDQGFIFGALGSIAQLARAQGDSGRAEVWQALTEALRPPRS